MPSVYLPPSLRHFEPRRVIPGPGSRHMALEYDLVEAIRPHVVVDAGASDAMSFFTYCQSMKDHDIDGSAYAVDGWEPTDTPSHPEATFDAINAHGRKNYPGIYYLMRMAAETGYVHFAEGGVDLLRMEGMNPSLRTHEVLDAWAARVRPGGVIVFAGAAQEAARDAWRRLAARGRSAVFPDGRGVGILQISGGSEPLPELLRLAFDDGERPALERLYDHAREHHQLRRAVAKMG